MNNNAERIPITADKMQGKDRYCSYVRAYFKAKRLVAGDTWIAHEYMAWIDKMHRAFRPTRGIPDFRSYNPQEQAEFKKFIFQEDADDEG